MVLKFSSEQFEAFEVPARMAWASEEAKRLHHAYLDYFDGLGVAPSALEPLCLTVEKWAAEHDVTKGRDVSQLCCVAATLGCTFWLDPRFKGYVNETLGDAKISRSKAVSLLVGKTADWLRILWQDDSLLDFSGRLSHSIRNGAEPTADTLRRIIPSHWVLFDTVANERLIAWLAQSLPPTEMPAQRLAYIACALVHGTGWLSDPQFVKIVQGIMVVESSDELANTISEIYGGIC